MEKQEDERLNPRYIRPADRFFVFQRDRFTCQYCGAKAPDFTLHIDHITPVSRGGTSDAVNLITACEPCNLGKGAKRGDAEEDLAAKLDLILRLKTARARKAARGEKAVGSYPFGHYPGEAETVELMKHFRADGLGFDRIAAELNRRGVQTRRGAKWGGNTINVILTRLGAA